MRSQAAARRPDHAGIVAGGVTTFSPTPIFSRMADRSVGVQSTPVRQLALYVTIYSAIRMAADLPENYEKRPDARQLIKDVPADWEGMVGVSAEVGDYAAIARKERDGTADTSASSPMKRRASLTCRFPSTTIAAPMSRKSIAMACARISIAIPMTSSSNRAT